MKYSFDAALPEGFTLDQVVQVMDARGYAWAHRFTAEDLQLAEEIWLLPEGRGAVRYVFDHFVDVPSIRAESDIFGEPGPILVDLQADLPLLHLEDLSRQAVSEPPVGRAYACRALAAISPFLDGGTTRVLRAALKDPDPAMRKVGMTCIARYPSFVFAKNLDALAGCESDPEIRAEAISLAADLRAHGRRGTL